MRNTRWTKLVTVMLTAAMLVSAVPSAAIAAEADVPAAAEAEVTGAAAAETAEVSAPVETGSEEVSTPAETVSPAFPGTRNTPVSSGKKEEPVSRLEKNYYNLMQMIVQFGEQPVEIEETILSIGDVIILTLENDEIKPPKAVYQHIIDEFKRHSKDEGFRAETFYKFHPDPEISSMAVEMIASPYRWVEAHDENRLGELVIQLLFEIKLTVIETQIEELNTGLKEAQQTGDWERMKTLLSYQPELLQRRNEISKQLGNRIITL